MGTICKRDNTYWIKYYKDGKPLKKSFGGLKANRINTIEINAYIKKRLDEGYKKVAFCKKAPKKEAARKRITS